MKKTLCILKLFATTIACIGALVAAMCGLGYIGSITMDLWLEFVRHCGVKPYSLVEFATLFIPITLFIGIILTIVMVNMGVCCKNKKPKRKKK